MRAPAVCITVVFAALATVRVDADDVPLVQPQWIATQTEDALVYDRIAASVDPVTIAMPDGGEFTATVTNDEIVLRRYDADGSVASTESAPAILEAARKSLPWRRPRATRSTCWRAGSRRRRR